MQKELAKTKAFDIDKGYMSESEVEIKWQQISLENLIELENQEITKEEEARQALTKLDLESERIRVTKNKKEQEEEEFQKKMEQEQQSITTHYQEPAFTESY